MPSKTNQKQKRSEIFPTFLSTPGGNFECQLLQYFQQVIGQLLDLHIKIQYLY